LLVSPDAENRTPISVTRLGSNFDLYKNIQLLAYALMPNHFHFLFKQFSENAITEFMRRITNAYVQYFNNKYKRVGPLFQGRYKGVLVDKDDYFIYLSSYIHINPIELPKYSEINTLEDYPYSSYSDYIGKTNTPWIHREYILNYINDKEDKFLFYKNQTEKLTLESDKYKKEFSSLILE